MRFGDRTVSRFGWLAIIAVLAIAIGVFLASGRGGERHSEVLQVAPKTQILSPADN